jgi:metal-responsive CopG/Arc/MetJ family transcriptional regulator
MQNDARITVRIPKHLDDAIDELAQELNLAKAEVIRNALTSGVVEGRQASKRLKNPAVRAIVRSLLAIENDPEQLALFERVLAPGAVPGNTT